MAVKTVLIIDDSETIRYQVRLALAPVGYSTVEAVDGIDGLAKLKSTPDVAVVLCDVNMPNMNGLDMVAAARAEGLTTPIVMLTSEGQPSLMRKAREVGATGWIVKPFNVDMLVAAVNKIAC